MLNKIQASSRLYLLVFVMSLFIIGIGLYGINEIKTMNQNTRTLYADRVVPMEQLSTVRYTYAVGIISTTEQVQTRRLTFNEAIKRVQEARETIATLWSAYMLTYLTPRETLLAGQAVVLMRQSDETVDKLKAILDKKDVQALNDIINNELYPAVNPVIAKLNELFDLQVKVGGEIHKVSTGIYNTSIKKFVLLIIISLVFAVPFSYYLVKNVKELITNIRASNLAIIRDMTERKKIEELLLQSEKKYRNIFENVQDVVYQTSVAGIVLEVSPSIKNHTGFTREEMIGTSVVDIYNDPEDREKGIKLLKEKGVLTDYEIRLKSKTGEPVYVSLNARLIADAGGHADHLDGVFRNITERKKSEESIKQSEANYRQLFEFSPAPMWVYDGETYRFIQVNQACIDHYGYSEEEFSAMTIMNISPGNYDTAIKSSSTEKHQVNAFFRDGYRHIKKSGEIIDVETSSIPVMLNGKKQILVIAIDVTERNRYEQKLTRAAIKAQEDERYEIGGELHDNVCQILASSLLFLGMIKKTLPEESTENFDRTRQSITLAADEIRNLSHRLAPAFFDDATMEDAFKNLLANFNFEKKYDIKMSFDTPSKSYPLSRDLQLNLYRILQEQLRNILKHARATAISVEVVINKNFLQMKITDNGIGFEVEVSKGGIGLANMNRRVQLFAGNFAVESSVGNGCTVLVEVPLP